MNKFRRKEIFRVIMSLTKAIDNGAIEEELNDIAASIEILQNEEEDYRDNMPENMQGGYKYEAADEACDNLSYAYDCVSEAMDCEDVNDYLKKAIKYLNEASV